MKIYEMYENIGDSALNNFYILKEHTIELFEKVWIT